MALSVIDFAEKIKSKYPEYSDMDDGDLANKIVAKYPEYSDMVDLRQPSISDIQKPNEAIASAYPAVTNRNITPGYAANQQPELTSTDIQPSTAPALTTNVSTQKSEPNLIDKAVEHIPDIATAAVKGAGQAAVRGAKLGTKILSAPFEAAASLTGSEEQGQHKVQEALNQSLGIDDASDFWKLTPEEQKGLKDSGLLGQTLSSAGTMLLELPAYIATGGIIKAGVEKLISKVGIDAVKKALPTISKMYGNDGAKIAQGLSDIAANVGSMAAVPTAETAGEKGFGEAIKELPQNLATGAAMAAGGGIGKLIGKAAPEAAKPILEAAGSAAGMAGTAKLEGGTDEDVISAALLGGVFPLAMKGLMPRSERAAEIYKKTPSPEREEAVKNVIAQEVTTKTPDEIKELRDRIQTQQQEPISPQPNLEEVPRETTQPQPVGKEVPNGEEKGQKETQALLSKEPISSEQPLQEPPKEISETPASTLTDEQLKQIEELKAKHSEEAKASDKEPDEILVEKNNNAIDFYKNQGYIYDEEKKKYVPVDAEDADKYWTDFGSDRRTSPQPLVDDTEVRAKSRNLSREEQPAETAKPADEAAAPETVQSERVIPKTPEEQRKVGYTGILSPHSDIHNTATIKFNDYYDNLFPAEKTSHLSAERAEVRKVYNNELTSDLDKLYLKKYDNYLLSEMKKYSTHQDEKNIATDRQADQFANDNTVKTIAQQKWQEDAKYVVENVDQKELSTYLKGKYSNEALSAAVDAVRTGKKDGKPAAEIRAEIVDLLKSGYTDDDAVEHIKGYAKVFGEETPKPSEPLAEPETGDLLEGTVFEDKRTPTQKAVDLEKQLREQPKEDKGTEGLPLFEKEQQASEQTNLFKNRAGAIDLSKAKPRTDRSDPDIDAVEKSFEKRDSDTKKKFGFSVKKILKTLGRQWVDRSGDITRPLQKDPYGWKAARDFYLIKGANTYAEEQVRKATSQIRDIFSKYGSGIEKDLADHLEAERGIEVEKLKEERGEKIVNPSNLKGNQYQKFIDSYKSRNPGKAQAVEKAEKIVWDLMADNVKKLNDAGLLTKEAYEYLQKHKHYYQREYIQHLDEGWQRDNGGRVISVSDSGLKTLEEGSSESLLNNPYIFMTEAVSRTQTRIFKNQANKSLYEYATKVKDNALGIKARKVEIDPSNNKEKIDQQITNLQGAKAKLQGKLRIPKDQSGMTDVQIGDMERKIEKIDKRLDELATKREQPVYKDMPVLSGHTAVSVMIDGERHEMVMPNELAKAWSSSQPGINEATAKLIHYFSGSFLLKPLATGINPYFAIRNVPRDIAHIFTTTQQYNPNLPIYILQIGKDLISVFGDAVMRKGRYKQYIKEGGGMELLTYQGQSTKAPHKLKSGGISELLHTVEQAMGYMNATSEILTRLALRERTLKNELKKGVLPGEASKNATFAARNYMDFAQGGTISKDIDTAFPYFNASIQGTRGLWRAFKEHPALTTYKAAQLIVIGGTLAYMNRNQHKEAWDSISDAEKENKFIFTTGVSYPDKNGETRYWYWAIPKEQSQRFFAQIGEALVDKDNNPNSKMWMSIKDMLPNIPMMDLTNIPPVINAIIQYTTNYDTWQNKEIWIGRKVHPHAEVRNNTSEFIKQTTDELSKHGIEISPIRAEKAIGAIFPRNIFTDALGAAWDASTVGVDAKEKDFMNKTIQQKLAELPFSKEIFRQTLPTQTPDSYETFKTAKSKGMLDKIKPEDLENRDKLIQINKDAKEKELSINDLKQQNDNELSQLIYDNKNDKKNLMDSVRGFIKIASKKMYEAEGTTNEAERLSVKARKLFKNAHINFKDNE